MWLPPRPPQAWPSLPRASLPSAALLPALAGFWLFTQGQMPLLWTPSMTAPAGSPSPRLPTLPLCLPLPPQGDCPPRRGHLELTVAAPPMDDLPAFGSESRPSPSTCPLCSPGHLLRMCTQMFPGRMSLSPFPGVEAPCWASLVCGRPPSLPGLWYPCQVSLALLGLQCPARTPCMAPCLGPVSLPRLQSLPPTPAARRPPWPGPLS